RLFCRARSPVPALVPYTTLFRSHERPERRERIRALPLHPLTAALELESSLAVVVVQRVTGDVVERVGFGHVPSSPPDDDGQLHLDRKSTRLDSSHVKTSYAAFCL